ncbi:MAG: hypothetical protein ACXW3Z_07530, partial [Limisphaerales bacterium]
MRKLVLVTLVAWVATSSEAQSSKDSKPETLLRWSFLGTTELAKNDKLTVFNTVRALPEAAAFRDVLASNLAQHATLRFASRGSSNVQLTTFALIKPLIPDLIQNESRFQMDTKAAQDADWMLAIKLPAERSTLWSRSLAELAALTGLQGASPDKSNWTASHDKYKISFSRAKEWTIVEGGFGEPNSKASKSFRDALGKRSGKTVLDAQINPPLLGKIWSAPQLAHYPRLSVK